ncbi:UDP-N-acetylmuramate dehydrogenase [Anaeroselena agilis]|uniref:UDP-N-acetylenolpyruvoylglucosamine reductase n=1 Tax=Anaeroselena agilis TaxID=3063788 RepID=A0ABU3NUR4_9FIRM|nr:UDP-N-acetylmuramate dehydrogenase [Selenomonadales bacterium 4137-cl]
MQRIKLKDDFSTQLQNIISGPRLLLDEPMSKHTTFRIGGPADYLVLPASAREVAAVLILARECGIPVTILGNGSNVLVRDKGIRGLVLKFDVTMGSIRHNGATVKAGAGASLGDVARYAAAQGLTGLEFAVGIPGSIGGAVFMNAGAYEGEIGCFVSAVTAVCPDGRLQRFAHADIRFGYRDSIFQHNGCIICEVELALTAGDDAAIDRKMNDYTSRREAKQPIEMPSAGSTFKRPPGYFAGTLIEQAGLKGYKIGGAQVSGKHAGFIVNAGGATAADVLALIKEVQRKVQDRFGVRLQPEVRIFGEE